MERIFKLKRTCKLALLLGFVSVVSIQSHSVQGAAAADSQTSDLEEQKKIGSVMHALFSDDRSDSPLWLMRRRKKVMIELADTVAIYMRRGDGKALQQLFYKPDLNAWTNLYQQVAPAKEFSVFGLVKLLRKSKDRILHSYKYDEGPVDGDAYLYFPLLLNHAIQQISQGCLGRFEKPEQTFVVKQGDYKNLLLEINTDVAEYNAYAEWILNPSSYPAAGTEPAGIYGFGTAELSYAQIYYIFKDLANDDSVSSEDKYTSLRKAFLSPKTSAANISRVTIQVVRDFFLDDHYERVIEWVKNISTNFGYPFGADGKKLSFDHEQESVLLYMYAQALSGENPEVVLPAWMTLFQTTSVLSSKAILSKLVEACDLIKSVPGGAAYVADFLSRNRVDWTQANAETQAKLRALLTAAPLVERDGKAGEAA